MRQEQSIGQTPGKQGDANSNDLLIAQQPVDCNSSFHGGRYTIQSTAEAGQKEILQQIRAEESIQKIERGGRNGQSDAQGVGRSEPKSLGQSETKGNGDDAAKRESAFSSCTGGTGAAPPQNGPRNHTN